MRPLLRPFRVHGGWCPPSPGVVTSFLRPGLTMLRPFGVLVCAVCGFSY